MGYIGAVEVLRIAETMKHNSYGDYLRRLLDTDV
jgi:hypothetical protein